jgi:hypothetical protein
MKNLPTISAHAGTGNKSVVIYKSFHSGDIVKKTNLTNEKICFIGLNPTHELEIQERRALFLDIQRHTDINTLRI